jgi:two-component system sensor histidine kinase AgrC
MIDMYELWYILSNIFGTYIVYKLMRVFFNEVRVNRLIELASYIMYYLINIIVFTFFRIPFVMMSTNLLLFFLLSLNYRSGLGKRLLACFSTYMILVAIEILVTVLFENIDMPIFKQAVLNSEIIFPVMRIVSLFVVITLSHFKNLKKDTRVPVLYWGVIISVLISSLYLLMIFMATNDFGRMQRIIIILIILTINFLIVILYDNLYRAFRARTEYLLLEQQNQTYLKQLTLMQQSLSSVKALRHDMRNHALILKNMCAHREPEMAEEYVNGILEQLEISESRVETGHFIIDSILNFKLQQIIDLEIVPEIKTAISQIGSISPQDITVVLGNLMDNAIDALSRLPKDSNRIFSIYIKYSKNNMIITIKNSFSGILNEAGGVLKSTKSTPGEHGLGIRNVKSVVDKYDGIMKISHSSQLFKVTISLPVN